MDIEPGHSLMELLEEEFMCPIYKLPIQNPVITPVGITYEKQSLEEWLDINGIEPQSKKPLGKEKLIQNLALKGLIQKIYKEVPKMQRSLTQKDDIIANLTEELTQVRKQLEYQKQKSQENEQLTECTFEKTKKIRKIQEDIIRQKQLDRVKLKQKVKEVSHLRDKVSELIASIKSFEVIISECRESISKFSRQKDEIRREIADIRQDLKEETQTNRRLQNRLSNFDTMSHQAHRCQQRHRQYLLQSVFAQMDNFLIDHQNNNLTFQRFENLTNTGVDSILSNKQRELLQKAPTQQYGADIAEIFRVVRNQFRIHRYMMKYQRNSREVQQEAPDHKLKYLAQHDLVGYSLDIVPFTVPPTIQELSIDWPQVISIHVDQIDSKTWQVFMDHIEKFPKLTQIGFKKCTANNITQTQLQSMKKLKGLCIEDWQSVPESSTAEIRKFTADHPDFVLL